MAVQIPSYDYRADDEKIINQDLQESGTYGEAQEELLKLIIKVRELLVEFEHSALRGEYRQLHPTKGEQWVKAIENQKVMNEIGIREIIARLSGIVNEKTIMGYISEEDYYKKMLYFDMSVSEMFAKRSDIWELDIEMAKPIKDAMIEIADAVLSMSIEGFTAINFKTQYSKHDIQRNQEGQQSEGGGSFMGIPLGKRK